MELHKRKRKGLKVVSGRGNNNTHFCPRHLMVFGSRDQRDYGFAFFLSRLPPSHHCSNTSAKGEKQSNSFGTTKKLDLFILCVAAAHTRSDFRELIALVLVFVCLFVFVGIALSIRLLAD